jgi:hypothetical protein
MAPSIRSGSLRLPAIRRCNQHVPEAVLSRYNSREPDPSETAASWDIEHRRAFESEPRHAEWSAPKQVPRASLSKVDTPSMETACRSREPLMKGQPWGIFVLRLSSGSRGYGPVTSRGGTCRSAHLS